MLCGEWHIYLYIYIWHITPTENGHVLYLTSKIFLSGYTLWDIIRQIKYHMDLFLWLCNFPPYMLYKDKVDTHIAAQSNCRSNYYRGPPTVINRRYCNNMWFYGASKAMLLKDGWYQCKPNLPYCLVHKMRGNSRLLYASAGSTRMIFLQKMIF